MLFLVQRGRVVWQENKILEKKKIQKAPPQGEAALLPAYKMKS
jgi:hypothetical protein